MDLTKMIDSGKLTRERIEDGETFFFKTKEAAETFHNKQVALGRLVGNPFHHYAFNKWAVHVMH